MFHLPIKEFFYSSYRIHTEFSDETKTLKGAGTGFVLEIAPGVAWIITNRHVIDIDYRRKDAKYKNFKLSQFIITGRDPNDQEYSFYLHEDAEIFYHEDYENDVAIIRAHVYLVPGQRIHWHFTLSHLATKEIYQTILPFDWICYSGFPPTHDKLANRPIVRSGHIASDPRFDYSWDSDNRGQCVAYEGFSYEGSSGSPIFVPPRGIQGLPDTRHGYLIGINAGHIPVEHGVHSGISYFYKSTVILEIIEKNNLKEKLNN